MHLYTIGFTGKSAREFFTILKHSDVKKVIDVRLWPNTQLSGQQACVTGIAPLSVSKKFPQVFMQLLGGAFSFYQQEVGYMDIQTSIEKKRSIPFIHPTQEELFVASQNGSMTQLDKGLNGCRGKPKTPKRNNYIKKREAMLIRKGLLPKKYIRTRE